MNNCNTPFGIRRNLNYIKTSFIIHLKQIKEYKSNLYLGFLANTSFMLMFSFFLYNLKDNFTDLFYWELKEFLFFMIFVEIIVFIFHPLFVKDLTQFLLSGDFNNYLIRPVNSFTQYAMNSSDFFASFVNILYISLLTWFLIFIYPEFSALKLLITFLFGIIGGLFYLSIIVLTRATSFFMKKSNTLFKTFKKNENIFFLYPSTFFKASKMKFIILLFPVTYYGAYATEYFFGIIHNSELLKLIIYLTIMTTILTLISTILWKKGIKKYEAFS